MTRQSYLTTRARFPGLLPPKGSIRLDEVELLAAVAAVERERNRFLERLRSFERKRIREKMRGKRSPRPAELASLYQLTAAKDQRQSWRPEAEDHFVPP